MSMDCYTCNKRLSEEEMQRWQPFGLCDECQHRAEYWKQQEQWHKHRLHIYWTLPAEQRDILRSNWFGSQESEH